MSRYLAVSIIGLMVAMVTTKVIIKPLSSFYLPSTFFTSTDPGKYDVGEEGAKKFAYDEQKKIAYVMGRKALHVVDVSNPSNMAKLYHVYFDDVGADVTVCKGYVFALIRSRRITERGNVVVYKPFDKSATYLEKVKQIQVYASPNAIEVTRDCTAVVTNEGEPGVVNTVFTDPEGSISIITFTNGDPSNSHVAKQATFTKFNDKKAELVQKGVRFIYPGATNNNKLSQDLEPESIAFNADETKAYIPLQENNALAVVDIASAEVTDILPLGYTSWNTYGLDASDRDGGIKIQKWPIRGLYQPDGIRFVRQGGVDYLVTANEGAMKHYTLATHFKTWSETMRGSGFVNLLSSSLNSSLHSALSDASKLGRLLFTKVNDKDSNGKYTNLYTFGTRSFSIRKVSDLSIVYDSGNDIEEKHKFSSTLWNLFNSGYGNRDKVPTEEMDQQSDDQGPEPASLEIAEVDGVKYMFLGNAKISSIMVYSLSDVKAPVFEGLYRNGKTDQTWQKLYEARTMGDIDPRDLRFVPASKSPTGRNMLLVAGAISGTISAYDIEIPKTTTTRPKPTTIKKSEQTTGTSKQGVSNKTTKQPDSSQATTTKRPDSSQKTTKKTTSTAVQHKAHSVVPIVLILLTVILNQL